MQLRYIVASLMGTISATAGERLLVTTMELGGASDIIQQYFTWWDSFKPHVQNPEMMKLTTAEQNAVFSSWKDNLEFIKAVNNDAVGFELAVGPFTHMTDEQFGDLVGFCPGGFETGNEAGTEQVALLATEAHGSLAASGHDDQSSKKPRTLDSVDWTERGMVTPVKNSGLHASCWATSTAEVLESRSAIAHGNLRNLSVAELVACTGEVSGNPVSNALRFLAAHGGVHEASAFSGECAPSREPQVIQISGFEELPRNDEAQLMQAVAEGPVSVAIQANERFFQHYGSGILTVNCGAQLNHAVLVVGFGHNGVEGENSYWKVKNSWGPRWGEKGYIRLCRSCFQNGASGLCGVASQPVIPVL